MESIDTNEARTLGDRVGVFDYFFWKMLVFISNYNYWSCFKLRKKRKKSTKK